MIKIQDLRKTYGSFVALENFSDEIQSGEVFGVIGQSGAGKSTLIRCINRLETPTSGSVIVDGQEITALSGGNLRRARQNIGMIFQHFNLLSSRTAAENIAFPLEVLGQTRLQRKARVEELLSLVGLEGRGDSYPSQLSGGQKQRVGIARALAVNPKVLLSDEATSALDPHTTRSILDLLKDLNQRTGLTILLITHDMGVVKRICDRVAILEKGKVVEQGSVVDLAAQPKSRLAQDIIPLTRIVVGTTVGSTAALVPLTLSAIPFFARVAETSLLEVDRGLIEAAESMGCDYRQIILKVLIPEALPSLILGLTIMVISLIGYSAMAGVVGGGGLGDLAIRYGYQRFDTGVMLITVVLLVVLVQIVQFLGDSVAQRLRRR